MNKSAFHLRNYNRFAAMLAATALSAIGLPANAVARSRRVRRICRADRPRRKRNNMDINGGAAVDGDVGVSDHLHLDLGSGAKVGTTAGTGTVVDGTIYLNPGATVKLQHQPPGSVMQRDMSQAVTDAISANHAAAALTPTQNLGGLDISGQNYTIAGNGGDNVISLSSFKLHGGGSLTLKGSANDYFVFKHYG